MTGGWLSVIERSGGDGWTIERLAGRLGLPVRRVDGAIRELARVGLVENMDGEWVSTLGVEGY